MDHLDIQDRRIPKLGFGTWQLEGDDCYNGVRDALDLGYRHIDTAQIYGNEDRVGEAIADDSVDRDEIFLTTKVWRDKMQHDDVISSTEESLRKLRTDYVDLLLIHWPNDEVELEETLGALQELQQQGKTKLIGVSNFPARLVDSAVSLAPIACNQVEYHPYLDQLQLRRQAEEHGMMLTAYSPLARQNVIDDEVLQELGASHDKSPAQVALRWLVQQPQVSAIPKASSTEHRRANLDIFDFELTDEEMTRITNLSGPGRLIDPDWAPDWAA